MGETDLTQTGELMRFTISANMAGIPAISVPVGHCSKGVHFSHASAFDACIELSGTRNLCCVECGVRNLNILLPCRELS